MQDRLEGGNTRDPTMKAIEGRKVPPGQPYQDVVPDTKRKEDGDIGVCEVAGAV